MSQQNTNLPTWSSKWVFILATTGSAVGLGNIWRFPYIAGENGGGAFVLAYIAFVLILGFPILLAEILIGRRGGHNPAKTMGLLAEISGRSRCWKWVGLLTIFSGLALLTYYNVIAGWTLSYIFKTPTLMSTAPNDIANVYVQMISSASDQILWLSIILIATLIVLARGVKKGLEVISWIMTPGIFILLTILLIFAIQSDGFLQGFEFLLKPDFQALGTRGLLAALGHSFFTLSIATASMMMYGAYLDDQTSIPSSTITVIGADTIIAIVAGLVIFPIVFSFGLNPDSGTGLAFKTLPLAFQHMEYGAVFSIIFFSILVFAAFTSIIALVEPAVVWQMESFQFKRSLASFNVCFLLWLIGILLIFSLTHWQHFTLFGMNLFDFANYVSANIMMPFLGFLIAIFAGWVIHRHIAEQELGWINKPWLFNTWYFIIRFIVPIGILVIAGHAIGLFNL